MSEAFSKFKTRYILIDCIITMIIAVTVMHIIAAIVAIITGLNSRAISNDKIIFYTTAIAAIIWIFWCTYRRLKENGIQSKYLIGNISPPSFPWMMLMIIFYGIETLQHGITQVTTFFVDLIAPGFVKSEMIKNCLRLNYSKDDISLTFVFYVIYFIAIVVVTPIVEEFLFRGIVLHRFSNKWGIAAGITISSMLFGLAHMNLAAIGIGISFIFVTLTYIKFPSMLVPIAYHTLHNAISFISKIIAEISGAHNSTDITLKFLWFGLLDILFALPILLYFLKWPNSIEALPYNVNSKQTS